MNATMGCSEGLSPKENGSLVTAMRLSASGGLDHGLPRKILGYKNPEELFELELDLIYAR